MTLCIVSRSACRESSVMKLSALQKASEGRPRERRKSCVQRKLDTMVKSALDLSSPWASSPRPTYLPRAAPWTLGCLDAETGRNVFVHTTSPMSSSLTSAYPGSTRSPRAARKSGAERRAPRTATRPVMARAAGLSRRLAQRRSVRRKWRSQRAGGPS